MTVWTPDRAALWARIAAHDFEPDQPLNFTRRLARDKGWPLAFAQGAVLEYRRFCFLALSGAGTMTPSEEVDEVWHQHLTYSRDYWDRWCGEALQTPLHHDPTAGGPGQLTHFRGRYAATLIEYEKFFGPPPEAYWPATHIRFGSSPRYRVIDVFFWIPVPRLGMVWSVIRGVGKRWI